MTPKTGDSLPSKTDRLTKLAELLIRAGRWLTRGYRHEFGVVQPFVARSAISDTERMFNTGEKVTCDRPEAPTVMLETGGAFFLVDRLIFEACCKAIKPTTMGP